MLCSSSALSVADTHTSSAPTVSADNTHNARRRSPATQKSWARPAVTIQSLVDLDEVETTMDMPADKVVSKPKDPFVHHQQVGPRNFVSPTGLTHSIPRPKSPRYPHREGSSTVPANVPKPTGTGTGLGFGFLAAEHFQNTETDKHVHVQQAQLTDKLQQAQAQQGTTTTNNTGTGTRRRSRDRIGKGCNVQVPALVSPGVMTACTAQSAKKSRAMARKMRPLARDSFRGCVRESVSVGRRMTECFGVAADIYQQECSTNHRNRGDDAMFFASTEAKNFVRMLSRDEDFDSNSMAMSESDQYEYPTAEHAYGQHDYDPDMTPRKANSAAERKGRSPNRRVRGVSAAVTPPVKGEHGYRKSKSPGSKSPGGKRRGGLAPSESDYGVPPSEVTEWLASPPVRKSPVRRSRSPTRKSRSPVQKVASGSEYGIQSEVFDRLSRSPIRKSRSPIRKSRSRTGHRISPIEKSESDEVSVSDERSASPSRKMNRSPVQMRKSPIRSNDNKDTPFRSNKGVRYPEAAEIMDNSMHVEPPTPRRPRGTYEQDDTLEILQQPLLTMRQTGTEYTDLRDLRMQIFVQDKKNDNGNVVPEARFSRTLEELEIQDVSIKKLETELNTTKNLLDQTRRELTKSQKSSQKQKQLGTATAEKLFAERVDMEEKLRREMRENDKLLEHVAGLQNESVRWRATSLMVGADGQVEGTSLPDQGPSLLDQTTTTVSVSSSSSQNDAHNPQCPETPPEEVGGISDHSAYLSSSVISLRAEIVELQSELAEARAAQLTAQQCRVEIEEEHVPVRAEGEQLKEQVLQLKQEIEVLEETASRKEKEGNLEILLLQAEIRGMKDKLGTTAQDVLDRCKEHERMEKALNQTQDEATKLSQQVTDLISKVARLEVRSDDRNKASEQEGKKLQVEISTLREKLAKSNEEIIDQAAEHLGERMRMQEALSQSQQGAHVLQSKVVALDDQVAAAEDEAHRWRVRMEEDDKASRATDASRASQIVRYMNRKMAGADTATVMELFRAKDNI